MKNNFDIYTGADLVKLFETEGFKDGDMLVGTKADGNDYNHCEFIYDATKTSNNLPPVFGWGSVKRTIEPYAEFSKIDNLIMDKKNRNYKYSVLYD